MKTPGSSRDLILVHVPASVGSHLFIMQMAVGLVAIAEYLRKHNYNIEIIHLGLERLRDPSFSLAKHVEATKPRFVGFSVQWHWQLAAVLEEAETLKTACPWAQIVFGGLTASFYAEEIQRRFHFVNYVIRGDAEIPLAALLRLQERPSDFQSVPNLTWRDGPDVRTNVISYVASSDDMSSFSYGVSEAVRLLDLYLRTGIKDDLDEPSFISQPAVTLCPARGCVHSCSFCSGSCSSMPLMTGRTKPAWVSWPTMATTVKRCLEAGAKHFYLSADIGLREKEYIALAEHLKKSFGSIRMDIEAWTIPSESFLQNYSKCFHERSVLVLSPSCGSENIRKANRSCFFSNHQYERTIAACNELGIKVWLYFTMGLPFETTQDIEITIAWQRDLRSRFTCIEKIETQPQQLEPGSPMFLQPDKYKIRVLYSSLDDFVNATPVGGIGYATDTFSPDEILSLCNNASV